MNIFLNSTDNINDKLCFININNNKNNINNVFLLHSNINYSDNIFNKINKTNIINTNIFFDFNFNYTNDNVNQLLNNIYDKELNLKILEKYNLNYNNYTNNNKTKLDKLLHSIEELIFSIKKHIKLYEECDIIYVDIINKNIKQYFEKNKVNIIKKLLSKIEIFYILSIIFNNSNNIYLLYYNTDIVSNIKKYI
tara:strand:+ start:2299 stop:2880 length:582 start_codon:yes stop_codon:yes gene_type:complete